ncbi:hypothetical protein AN216_21565 [Streptomyces oceani]|uniref:PPM-type phosphatase domain-containing protein n=1 Tax=Streptomyces oceani TaxID=1075402 RepID=A0A1E7JXG1_9ACTN|nr:hypothetical protein AN216_21565 [Streptomyces oceani]
MLVLPWLLILGVFVAELVRELASGEELQVGSLLSPAPALAAIRGGRRAVLTVSLAASAAAFYTFASHETLSASQRSTSLSAVLVVSVASVSAANLRERRAAQLTQVQRVAEAAQLAVLRPMPQQVGDLRLAVRYVAAESEARIGGDLYEAVVRPHSTRFIIGDVRGKGLPAIRTAAAVLGTFREAAQYEPTLSRIAIRCSESVARLDRSSVENGQQPPPRSGRQAPPRVADDPAELFVTAIVLEIEGPVLRLVNLGHPAPLLLSGPAVEYVRPAEYVPPLGLAHQLYEDLPAQVHAWRPGDRLLLYTDGIAEARDRNGQFFPLVECVSSLLGTPTGQLPDALLRAVDRHGGQRLKDDAAVLLVEWRGEWPVE